MHPEFRNQINCVRKIKSKKLKKKKILSRKRYIYMLHQMCNLEEKPLAFQK